MITPSLARAHKDVRTIPLLACATITRKSTLRELKFQISNHLQIPILDVVQPSQECNCSFARQIDERALRTEAHPHPGGPAENDMSPLLKFIVVYGQNRVQIVETQAADKISLVEAVRQELGGEVRSKEINFIGGTTSPNSRQVAICHPPIALIDGVDLVTNTPSCLYFQSVPEPDMMRSRPVTQAAAFRATLICTHPRHPSRPQA